MEKLKLITMLGLLMGLSPAASACLGVQDCNGPPPETRKAILGKQLGDEQTRFYRRMRAENDADDKREERGDARIDPVARKAFLAEWDCSLSRTHVLLSALDKAEADEKTSGSVDRILTPLPLPACAAQKSTTNKGDSK